MFQFERTIHGLLWGKVYKMIFRYLRDDIYARHVKLIRISYTIKMCRKNDVLSVIMEVFRLEAAWNFLVNNSWGV